MVKNNDDPSKRRRWQLTPEQKWIREFLEFYGTDNITRFCQADLNDVSLIRIVEVLTRGDHVSSEKCDGHGAVCIFEHASDDDQVEVTVWFAAGEMELEIKWARKVKEMKGEPDAA
jgi:hypothetical protein